MMGGAWFLNHPAPPRPVPAGDGQRRRHDAPRHQGPAAAQLGARGRVVQLHRRARERPRPAQARREHVRRAGRIGGGRRPPDRVVLELRRRAPLLHRARPQRHATGPSPTTSTHIRGAIEWAAGEAAGRLRPAARGLPTDASFDKVTLDDTTENPMEIAVDADGNVFYVELGRQGQALRPRPTARSARSARSRSTAATRTACSGSRSTPTSPPTAGSTSSTARRRPRSSTSRASRSRPTARWT